MRSLDEHKEPVSTCLHAMGQVEGDAIAFAVPKSATFTFADLIAESEICARALDNLGIKKNDRVGILLPNSPAMITTFIGVVSRATAAPLNPVYSTGELEFYLSDLNAKALMVASDLDIPARFVAKDQGIPVVDVAPVGIGNSVSIEPSGAPNGRSLMEGNIGSGDIALVLHTSGTTSRPKIVPLTHANILASANNIIRTLNLTSTDRCLTIMPLFHIHGFMVTLSALLAGGQVCPVGFEPQRFFKIIDEFKPTWYSAVPTMHQAILSIAAVHTDAIQRSRLRFIRSSSAALPRPVKTELEKVFNVPVIEAYGMTEAAHQMASNPLPPKAQKSGSVGLAAGPHVAVMDSQGKLLSADQTGEIVIRGANVFRGYEKNERASAETFTAGWFRTGDEGYFDNEGYLFLTGRLKDIINRGGEKISPAEVDEVLLNHSGIEQAITFPVPHATLGEGVAAAIVPRQGVRLSEKEIREYAAGRMSAFKVPQRVLIVKEIPKGPTGKIQRRSVAEKLGLLDASATRLKTDSTHTAPGGTLESQFVRIWEELLRVRPVGIHDNFFELGGDSLLAVQMILRVHQLLGKRVSLATLFVRPTVSQLCQAIDSDRFGEATSLVIELNSAGARLPLFFLHGDIMGGGVFSLPLSQTLGPDQPMYVLSPHGLNGEPIPKSVEEMAASYVRVLRSIKPKGPYMLSGYCKGGVVAFEMARQLEQQGEAVPSVLMIAASGWKHRYRLLRLLTKLIALWKALTEDQRLELFNKGRYRFPFSEELQRYYVRRIKQFRTMCFGEKLKWFVKKLRKLIKKQSSDSIGEQGIDFKNIINQTQFQILDLAHTKALERHVPGSYSGKVTLLWPLEDRMRLAEKWKHVVPTIQIDRVPGSHTDCVTTHVTSLGKCMKAWLDGLDDCNDSPTPSQ